MNASEAYLSKLNTRDDPMEFVHFWVETDEYIIDVSSRMFRPENNNNLFLVFKKGVDIESLHYQRSFKNVL